MNLAGLMLKFVNFTNRRVIKILGTWTILLVPIITVADLTGCAADTTSSQRELTATNQDFAGAEMNQDAILHRSFRGPSGAW